MAKRNRSGVRNSTEERISLEEVLERLSEEQRGQLPQIPAMSTLASRAEDLRTLAALAKSSSTRDPQDKEIPESLRKERLVRPAQALLIQLGTEIPETREAAIPALAEGHRFDDGDRLVEIAKLWKIPIPAAWLEVIESIYISERNLLQRGALVDLVKDGEAGRALVLKIFRAESQAPPDLEARRERREELAEFVTRLASTTPEHLPLFEEFIPTLLTWDKHAQRKFLRIGRAAAHFGRAAWNHVLSEAEPIIAPYVLACSGNMADLFSVLVERQHIGPLPGELALLLLKLRMTTNPNELTNCERPCWPVEQFKPDIIPNALLALWPKVSAEVDPKMRSRNALVRSLGLELSRAVRQQVFETVEESIAVAFRERRPRECSFAIRDLYELQPPKSPRREALYSATLSLRYLRGIQGVLNDSDVLSRRTDRSGLINLAVEKLEFPSFKQREELRKTIASSPTGAAEDKAFAAFMDYWTTLAEAEGAVRVRFETWEV